MRGAWERLIRSCRKVLTALLSEQTLSGEGLLTLIVEVEAILNSRPLTPITLDPSSDGPLTPYHLLLQKGCAQLPPGVFSKEDDYGRRRWAQIQHAADQFWRRWRRKYLPTILQR